MASIERPYKKAFPVPEDPNLKITGFPLYLGYWGWLDWQKKLNYIHNVDTSYITVFRSPYTEPKVDYAIVIDTNFLQGKGPYGIPHEDLNSYSLQSWWPKVAHQMVTINQICNSGPGLPKYVRFFPLFVFVLVVCNISISCLLVGIQLFQMDVSNRHFAMFLDLVHVLICYLKLNMVICKMRLS